MFQKLLDTNKIEKAPIIEVIKKQPKEIILSALLRMSEQAPFYIFTAFVFAYAVGTLKMDRNFILSAVMVAACVSFFTIPISGHISDLIGRRKMYMIGVVTMGAVRIPVFRHDGPRDAGAGIPRHRDLAHSARYAVRTAGGVDRGIVHAASAL